MKVGEGYGTPPRSFCLSKPRRGEALLSRDLSCSKQLLSHSTRSSIAVSTKETSIARDALRREDDGVVRSVEGIQDSRRRNLEGSPQSWYLRKKIYVGTTSDSSQ